jgi:hypothetical protein
MRFPRLVSIIEVTPGVTFLGLTSLALLPIIAVGGNFLRATLFVSTVLPIPFPFLASKAFILTTESAGTLAIVKFAHLFFLFLSLPQGQSAFSAIPPRLRPQQILPILS